MIVTTVSVLFLICCRNINLGRVSMKFRIFYLSKGNGYVLYFLFASEVNNEMWDKLHDYIPLGTCNVRSAMGARWGRCP